MTEVYATMLSRLKHQWRNSPNILSLLTVLSKGLQDTNDAADYFLSHWSIDDADGELLDLFGQLIGVVRPLAQESPDNIFTLCAPGEMYDLQNNKGFVDDTDATVTTGGYLTSESGLESITDPGATMSDEDYRFLIRQKAASFRSKPTRENLFLYLIAFGARCKIDDDETFVIEFDPVSYYDLGAWQKYYIITRGFKPAGIKIQFRENMRNVSSI